jgi:hypothetical protein
MPRASCRSSSGRHARGSGTIRDSGTPYATLRANSLAQNHSSGHVAALRDDAGLVTSRRGALQAALAGPPPPTARPRWTRRTSPRLTAHYLDSESGEAAGRLHHSGRDATRSRATCWQESPCPSLAIMRNWRGAHGSLVFRPRWIRCRRGAIQSGILSTGRLLHDRWWPRTH